MPPFTNPHYSNDKVISILSAPSASALDINLSNTF